MFLQGENASEFLVPINAGPMAKYETICEIYLEVLNFLRGKENY